MTPIKIAEAAVRAADSRKAVDIKLLSVHDLTTIADYFVICSASSQPQVKAVCDEIERVLTLDEVKPLHREGQQSASWVLLDYGSVIVHVFHKETRDFYQLERLWSDAPQLDINELLDIGAIG